MRRHSRTRPFERAAIVGLLGVLLILASGATALAEDDDEDTFEQTIIKNILRGIGAQVDRGGIEYRERSPLVIPPTRDLPPPNAAPVVNNPAWPNDPDQRRKTAAASAPPFSPERLTPNELRKGARAGAGRVTAPQDTRDPGRNLLPSELGITGSVFGNILNSRSESETFTAEPPRTSLTQPPVGYQTPSPNFPYGLGKTNNNSTLNMPAIKDRAVGQGQ